MCRWENYLRLENGKYWTYDRKKHASNKIVASEVKHPHAQPPGVEAVPTLLRAQKRRRTWLLREECRLQDSWSRIVRHLEIGLPDSWTPGHWIPGFLKIWLPDSCTPGNWIPGSWKSWRLNSRTPDSWKLDSRIPGTQSDNNLKHAGTHKPWCWVFASLAAAASSSSCVDSLATFFHTSQTDNAKRSQSTPATPQSPHPALHKSFPSLHTVFCWYGMATVHGSSSDPNLGWGSILH